MPPCDSSNAMTSAIVRSPNPAPAVRPRGAAMRSSIERPLRVVCVVDTVSRSPATTANR